MSRLRSLAPAVACLLVWLLVIGIAPAAGASEGESVDNVSNPGDVFGGDRGKNHASDAFGRTRLTEEPVGLARGRGFNPFGTVATAFQQADCGNYYECNPDWDSDDGGDGSVTPTPTPPTPTPTPPPTPTPDPRIYEKIAFDRAHRDAVEWVNGRVPSFDTAPPPLGQVVLLRSFFWIYESWETKGFSSTENGIKVTITATPVNSVWRIEEENTAQSLQFQCDGPGHEYQNDPTEISRCGHEFDHSSAVLGDVFLTAAVIYEFSVVSSLADSRSNYSDGQQVSPVAGSTVDLDDDADAVTKGLRFPLVVNEILTYGIDEDFDPPTQASLATGPIRPEEARGCGVRETIAYYGTVGVPLRIMGVSCGEAFEVLDLLKTGVVACAGGIANSIGDVVTLLKNVVTDPVGTAKDGIAGLQALIAMAQDDPGEFVTTIGFGVLGIDKAEWDAAAGDDGKRVELAIGGLCAVAFEVIVGSAAKKILDAIPGRAPGNRPGDKPDRPRVCRSSFPTGTTVRMGTGELRPIELIEPGDYVLAADPLTGQWSTELVLNQWSYLDADQLTTATLADGSTITATDHHLFWVGSDQEWIELEYVTTGDQLLTPTGVTAVANVITHQQTETLVWELDTAGPDTFTVHTGTTDLLVHNADGCPIGNWTDRQRQGIEAGTELQGLDPVPPHRLRNLLSEFRVQEIFDANGNRFIIDKSAMEAILSRHHPRYFDPSSSRDLNTSFDGSATPDDIVEMMQDVLRNGDPLSGRDNMYRLDIDGVTYELTVDPKTGRVENHFAPQDPG